MGTDFLIISMDASLTLALEKPQLEDLKASQLCSLKSISWENWQRQNFLTVLCI